MKIYGLKNCDNCRKARKALDARLQDIRDEPLSREQLEHFFAIFGTKLLNTRSTTWRNLDETQRASEPVALLQEHPTLMKRPLIERGEELFLGWGKDVQEKLLGS